MPQQSDIFTSIKKTIALISYYFFYVFSSFVYAASAPYQPTTMVNTQIHIADLEQLVKPLTKQNLEVEANVWMKLVREKATLVSEAEILINQKQRNIDTAREISNKSVGAAQLAMKNGNSEKVEAKLKAELDELKLLTNSILLQEGRENIEGLNDEASLTNLAEKADAYTENQQRRHELLTKNITYLQMQKTALIERFHVVLNSWEEKGGDVSEMRLYADSLSGIHVNLNDSSALWDNMVAWSISTDGGLHWLSNIIKFALALCVIFFLSFSAGKVVDAATAKNKNLSILLKDFVRMSVRRIIIIIGFIVSLTFLEINVGPVLALIGAAGLVVGLALQGTLSNFASGMLILVYRPYDVGDVVKIDGVVGRVHSMTLLSTAVKTLDNQHMIVPNNNVWGSTIVNVTGSDTRRVDLVFGIGYEDDIAKAQSIMESILKSHSKILKSPAFVIKVHELGDSSVNFICRPWVKTADYWDVYWDVTRQVKEQFDSNAISIPFPQRDVHVYQASLNQEPMKTELPPIS